MRFVAFALLLFLPGANLVQAEEAKEAIGTTTSPAASPVLQAEDASADPAASDGDGDTIYLLTRMKLTGTDLTQVFFFRHPAITTLEACEEERNAGLTTGWNHLSRYYLKTLKSIPYKVEYLCVQSPQHMASWQRGVPMDHFYRVQA